MAEVDMATRLSLLRPLVKELGSALKDFQRSNSRFKVLKTFHPRSNGSNNPDTPVENEFPKTLFILDSSFNPPSIAHKTIIESALDRSACEQFPKPHRLLLLFAIMNADKAPSAASFDQRITMMSAFAQDVLDELQDSQERFSVVPIDIGITTVPYYTDKSAAIETEGRELYPLGPRHVHLVGFDTLTRFFAAKYYQKFDPPFSALEPYFGHSHRLRVTLRPDDGFGSEDDQREFVKKIADGGLEMDGGRREWADQIDLAPPNLRLGVSSTRIRNAARQGDWEQVSRLCSRSVMEWVKTESLYSEDDRGAKMA